MSFNKEAFRRGVDDVLTLRLLRRFLMGAEEVGYVRGHKTHITVTDDTSWQNEDLTDLAAAIDRMRRELPGWWWSIGSCHVSSDASCGPDRYGPDAGLLDRREFDDGFHADLRHPSTCAEALHEVIDMGLAAKAALN